MVEKIPQPGKKNEEEQYPKNGAMVDAFDRARIKKIEQLLAKPAEIESPVFQPPVPDTVESAAVPPELKAIYGDKVPPVVLETFAKLKNKETIKSFLAQKAAEEKEKKGKKRNAKPRARKPKAQAADSVDTQHPDLSGGLDIDLSQPIPAPTGPRPVTAEDLKRETDEEIKRLAASRAAAAAKPPVHDPDAPTIRIPMNGNAVSHETYNPTYVDVGGMYPEPTPGDLDRETLSEAAGMPPTTDVLRAYGTIRDAKEREYLLNKMRSAAEKKKQIEERMAAVRPDARAIEPTAHEETAETSVEDRTEPRLEKEPPTQQMEGEKRWENASYRVGTEIRDDNLEYVSIIPSAFEATPLEWREKLKRLIGKLTK